VVAAYFVMKLKAERDVQRNTAENNARQIVAQRDQYEQQLATQKTDFEGRLTETRQQYEQQLADTRQGYEQQLATLRKMNEEQVKTQLDLIREQMQTTSEKVLKMRQEELGERNREQVSKIIDPLQRSLKDMQEALDKTKQQQAEALTRLDESIKVNMERSAAIGETADRLTRALTGEVKVQGNFGELKLKQLLEDLDLHEGEQFDTQETLRDKAGHGLRGDDGKGLVPDFILHFPNNRHVVVDAKMSLTDYERYMNAEDGTPEKSAYLKAHLESVRAQVRRLARKEYTRYLPEGYNRLNFAIMYVPIEGALNLALLNDSTLWREAYDEGVMILGPQTMYMNLRVLEMMWTQVRQLTNQQAMMDAANTVIDRVQDFGARFADVEAAMNDTLKKMTRLKITTAEGGPSIITAARNLLKAGARENKKKKPLADMDEGLFIEE
jgi:DNA recombination protein RmuC